MANAAPTTKTAQIREAWAAGDKLGALRIASRFGDQSGDTKAMKRGWDAHQNPDFYRQVGKNPDELVEKAFAIIERKFISPKAKKAADPAAAKRERIVKAAKKMTKDQLANAVLAELRKPTRAEKPAKPAKEKPLGKRAAILEAAQRGELPPVPDFSAPTHARFRKKLDEVVAMAEAGDLKGLKAFHINPVSTSPKAIARYRDLAIVALEAQRKTKKEEA